MTDDQIRHMVYRFLTYELPPDFSPDNGITFEPKGNVGSPYEFDRRPVGTNLLTYTQAEQMVRYLVKDMPENAEIEDAGDDARISAASRREWAERAWRAEAYIDDVETAKGGLNLELIKQRSQIAALEAEGYRLRPLAEKWVAHLENRFEQSGDDGAAYHDWQAALAALNGEA